MNMAYMIQIDTYIVLKVLVVQLIVLVGGGGGGVGSCHGI